MSAVHLAAVANSQHLIHLLVVCGAWHLTCTQPGMHSAGWFQEHEWTQWPIGCTWTSTLR